MLFPLRVVLVVGLFLFLGISCHSTNSPPAKRLTPLKPRKVSNSPARQKVIRGLLVSRQHCESEVRCQEGDGCCPTGSQCCGTDHCCDKGSSCCDDIGCCDTNENCCEGGSCCPEGHNCAVADNGDEGCCPAGEDCLGSSNDECDTGYVSCSNENFCCPTGQTCSRDSDGNPTCGSQPIQTLTATTDLSDNQPTGTPNQGLQNVTIDLSSEAGITWSGDWVTVGSSCSKSRKGRSISGNRTSSSGFMAYSFTGTAAYLRLSGANTEYTVSIDGQETSFKSPSTHSGSDCTIT